MSDGYLLDTNHLGQAVRRDSTVRRQVVELRRRGVKVGTCVPVLCEIEAGVQQIREPEAYRANLEHLLRQIRIWPIAASTAKIYGKLHRDLRLRGRVLSQVDIMIAAMALELDLAIASTDHDFNELPGIRTVNWVG